MIFNVIFCLIYCSASNCPYILTSNYPYIYLYWPTHFNDLIFVICLHELCFKSKWESSGRNTNRCQSRYCENNTQVISK